MSRNKARSRILPVNFARFLTEQSVNDEDVAAFICITSSQIQNRSPGRPHRACRLNRFKRVRRNSAQLCFIRDSSCCLRVYLHVLFVLGSSCCCWDALDSWHGSPRHNHRCRALSPFRALRAAPPGAVDVLAAYLIASGPSCTRDVML